jgi:hypothetical protein
MPPASALRHPVSQSGTGPVQDWVPLFRNQTGSGIGIFVHSGTGLTGCRTVRHLKKAVAGGGERDPSARPNCW